MRRLILPISLLAVATFALQEADSEAAASTNEMFDASANSGITTAAADAYSSSATNNVVDIRRGDIPLDNILSSIDSNWRSTLQQTASSSGLGNVQPKQGAEQEQAANEQETDASTANQQGTEPQGAPAVAAPTVAPAVHEQAAPVQPPQAREAPAAQEEAASAQPPQVQEAPAPAPVEAPAPVTPAQQPPIRQQAKPVVGQVAGAPSIVEQEEQGEVAPNVQNRQIVVTSTYTLPGTPTGIPGYTTSPSGTHTPLPTTTTTPTLTTTRMPTTGASTIIQTVTATPLPRPSAANSCFIKSYSWLLVEVMLLSFVALAL